VLNQNLHADRRLYANCSTHTRLLLGASYVLLRREFVDRAPDCVTVSDNARHVLVTMGGSNPVNVIEKIVLALAGIDDPAMKVRVLVWPGNRRLSDLAKGIADPRIELQHAGDAMVETMQWADIAIAGAGTTTYELCFMGVPTLLVTLAENQNGVARAMKRESVCVDLGGAQELDADTLSRHIQKLRDSPEERLRMSSRGREVVDGRGGARVLEAMVQAS
jgi:spore coat polysaccharide biosynthesis predicted glycosyltransferase SpsG